MMKRLPYAATGLLLLLAAEARGVDFATDIQPLFAENCLECHGPDASKGGLILTTREGALKVLKSGAHGVVPGVPDRSEVLARVLEGDPEERMPPKEKKGLKPAEVEKLRAWIAEGAKYDLHGAYKPVKRSQVPAGTADWQVIDQFIQDKLKAKGLKGSPSAEAATLVKRVHYDLLGLPPTPEEVDAFVQETAGMKPTDKGFDEAYGRLVDRVLASPHYGERWGRHWLDAARYADSDGYEKDRPRPDAWRYRDWVIRAVNEDMPFDRFTIEQMAGDLLPGATAEQVVATAFHRQTLTNTEGGTDQEQFRIEACMDRAETLGTVWLGLTVGCARCHSHKYDQISHKEYYQLFSFFNNADEVTKQAPETPEKWNEYVRANGAGAAKLEALQKAVDAAKSALPVKLPEWEKGVQAELTAARAAGIKEQRFEPLKAEKVSGQSKAEFKEQADGSWLVSGPLPATDVYRIELAPASKPLKAMKIEVLTDKSLPKLGPGRKDNGNFVLGEVEVWVDGVKQVLHSAKADYTQSKFNPDLINDGNDQTGWAVSGGVGKPHHLTIQLAKPVSAGKRAEVRLVQGYKQKDHVIGRFRLSGSADITEESIMPPEVAKILSEEPKRRNPVVILPLWAWLEKVDEDVAAAVRALDDAKAKLPKPPLMDVRVIAERAVNPRQTKVLHRGDFLSPTDPVEPAAFGILPPIPSPKQGKATRLDLAKWLVSEDNPLTPRVTVNQMWGRLFGEGVVRTAADFGVRGEKPTHPELLDYLADRFMANGWSRKKLIRMVLMSRTYRQSSRIEPGAKEAELDPLNTMLWRQNRLRVEGEIVRDLHLAASGLLSRKIGGPSVFPPMPPDIADLSYANNFKWANSQGEDRHRRGMYTFFKRTAPHPDLTTFDCPDANLTNIKRTVSNTPLQALTTLNAEAFSEAGRALAKRVLTEVQGGDEDRLVRCFRFCLCRKPESGEVAALEKLLNDSRNYYQDRAEEAKQMVGTFAVKDVPDYEVAAWAATARIVLNMDEVIVRE